MPLRVIGAGFGRTGTFSLKTALERLGFGPCYHMMEVSGHPHHVPVWSAAGQGQSIDWDALFEDYAAAVDWPAAAFWRELSVHYPDAKVVLTTRDPERWYESVLATILRARERHGDDRRAWREMIDTVIWDGTFGGKITDRERALEVFRRHHQEVTAALPPERLLVYRVAEGWEPLCRFLEVPVPDEPFPQLNDRASFQERVLGQGAAETAEEAVEEA